MGESKRRREKDSNYGKPKSYMSELEHPYTIKLVTYQEIKKLIKSLKDWVNNHDCYASVVHEHTLRWKKIEKLCQFIGMEKVLDKDNSLFNTSSIFVSKNFNQSSKDKLINYYKNLNNKSGISSYLKEITREKVKLGLEMSERLYKERKESEDIRIIYKSDNCTAFYVPSDEPTLKGLNYIEFFIKHELLLK